MNTRVFPTGAFRTLNAFAFATVLLLLVAIQVANAAGTGPWVVWEDCRLDAEQYFDGDSFHVRHGSETAIIRLYFVDAPEIDDGYGELLDKQAAHFKIGRKSVLIAGGNAREFTEKFLQSPFRVITRMQTAPGASRSHRYYGIVEAGGVRLDVALVRAGFARVSGVIADYPNAAAGRRADQDLRAIEKEAAAARRGVWVGASGFVSQLKDSVAARAAEAIKSRLGAPQFQPHQYQQGFERRT